MTTRQDLTEDTRTEKPTDTTASEGDATAAHESDASPHEGDASAPGRDASPQESDASAPGRDADAPGGDADDPVPGEDRETAETGPDDKPEGNGTGGGRFTRVRVVGALAAMLVAAIAATAVLQGISAARAEDARARLAGERASRLEVSGAASAFSTALLSYDYRDLQTTRSTLAAQATGDFLSTYDEAFGGAMAQVIVKLRATARATVREVYLAEVGEATARAIVVVDQQVNTSEAIRSVKDSHLKVSMVKEQGVWKVHDVTVLGAAAEDQYNLDGDEEKKD
ncbi:hypothetical protein [Nonomuraea jiangxiensis]|uniref:Mce-associated membrane protein n=1 Tax=Nonomuraea jiangxiensis TaxID=633440 RepID=A0A1G8HYY3_9ACTN|nr:hypothetical protein [Nonomuraea jiangxiensis]SDI11843.1 Mce-associated membrane protein [Nonomuraea jiangxiensis]